MDDSGAMMDEESGMMEEESGMMADSAQMVDSTQMIQTMEAPGMTQDSSAMGGMGDDSPAPMPDTSRPRRP
jgi:hypothetical protein